MKYTTVKALRSLVKQLKQQLEDVIQKRHQHEVRKAMLIHDKETLMRGLQRERESLDAAHKKGDVMIPTGSDMLHLYEQRVLEKTTSLDDAIETCETAIQDQQSEMLQLFQQKKSYDTLIQQHEAHEKSRHEKEEREALDEVGARISHTSQKNSP